MLMWSDVGYFFFFFFVTIRNFRLDVLGANGVCEGVPNAFCLLLSPTSFSIQTTGNEISI